MCPILGVILLLLMIPFVTMLLPAMAAYGPGHGLMAAALTRATIAFPRGVTDTLSVDVRSESGLRHSLVYSESKYLRRSSGG
jgi:hypothetical protein